MKFYEEKLRELHGVEISDRIPENYLALSVRRGVIDLDEIKARYPREVVEKMLTLGSSIIASRPDGSGIGYVTELRLTMKKGEGIPVHVEKDAEAAVAILHSLTDPIDKYIYRTKRGTEFIKKKLAKEGIEISMGGNPVTFNAFHFGVFVSFYNMIVEKKGTPLLAHAHGRVNGSPVNLVHPPEPVLVAVVVEIPTRPHPVIPRPNPGLHVIERKNKPEPAKIFLHMLWHPIFVQAINAHEKTSSPRISSW